MTGATTIGSDYVDHIHTNIDYNDDDNENNTSDCSDSGAVCVDIDDNSDGNCENNGDCHINVDDD